VLCSLASDESLLNGIMSQPLMHVKCTWCRKMLAALTSFCTYQILVCERKNWVECSRRIKLMRDEILPVYKTRCQKEKKLASARKHNTDRIRLQNYPEQQVVQAAVREAMLYIGRLAMDMEGHQQLTTSQRSAATTALVGIIHYNSFAGRVGEWQHMLKEHVKSQIEKGLNYLECEPDHYKTGDCYGYLAKYIPPGTVEAFKAYLKLPGHDSPRFLKPLGTEQDTASVSKYLKKFGSLYMQLTDPPNSNLIRKQYHTLLLRYSMQGKVMKLLSKVDAHSERVAKQIYCTMTLADDAELGKMLHEFLFGEPVEWPTHDAIAAMGEQAISKLEEACFDSDVLAICDKADEEEADVTYLLESTDVEGGDGVSSMSDLYDGDLAPLDEDHASASSARKSKRDKIVKKPKHERRVVRNRDKKHGKALKTGSSAAEADFGITACRKKSRSGEKSPFTEEEQEWLRGVCMPRQPNEYPAGWPLDAMIRNGVEDGNLSSGRMPFDIWNFYDQEFRRRPVMFTEAEQEWLRGERRIRQLVDYPSFILAGEILTDGIKGGNLRPERALADVWNFYDQERRRWPLPFTEAEQEWLHEVFGGLVLGLSDYRGFNLASEILANGIEGGNLSPERTSTDVWNFYDHERRRRPLPFTEAEQGWLRGVCENMQLIDYPSPDLAGEILTDGIKGGILSPERMLADVWSFYDQDFRARRDILDRLRDTDVYRNSWVLDDNDVRSWVCLFVLRRA
jgi:hypothetical protein